MSIIVMFMLHLWKAHARVVRLGIRVGLIVIMMGFMAMKPASAQTTAQQGRAAVDSLAQAFKAGQTIPGLVIGMLDSSGTRVLRYGVASLEDSVQLRATTRFEIGSVTKPFTALLLAERARRGAVGVTDSVGRYLPDSVRAPAYEGRPIELHHLATHTSGLPRLPGNFDPANPANPYADYTTRELHTFLDGFELSRAPGTKYAYSNVGGGLLGHLLACQANTSFAALLRTHLLQALGLEDTYLSAVSDRPREELAVGYGMMGRAAYWQWDALAGAGALHSTVEDLLRFLHFQLHPEKSSLASAIRRTHTIQHRISDQQALTLGWHVAIAADGARAYWHNGGTGGFRSFVGFVPKRETALVVLVNKAVPLQPFNQFAFRMLRALR